MSGGADQLLRTPIRWAKGGTASVVTLEADRITVSSSTPSAPGSRPEGTLPSGARFWMKVARCRKDGDGFVIDGRVLDATRDTRLELGRLAPASGEPTEPT